MAFPAAASAAGPSRTAAKRYAHRTYIVQFHHRRPFALIGRRHAVRAKDGSLITAFPMRLADSGDGTGQAVELFRGRRFLGWASAYDTVRLRVSTTAAPSPSATASSAAATRSAARR